MLSEIPTSERETESRARQRRPINKWNLMSIIDYHTIDTGKLVQLYSVENKKKSHGMTAIPRSGSAQEKLQNIEDSAHPKR